MHGNPEEGGGFIKAKKRYQAAFCFLVHHSPRQRYIFFFLFSNNEHHRYGFPPLAPLSILPPSLPPPSRPPPAFFPRLSAFPLPLPLFVRSEWTESRFNSQSDSNFQAQEKRNKGGGRRGREAGRGGERATPVILDRSDLSN